MESKGLYQELGAPSGNVVFDFGIGLGDFEQRDKNQDIVSSNHRVTQPRSKLLVHCSIPARAIPQADGFRALPKPVDVGQPTDFT
jgi:hypothetical protein